MLAYGQYIKKWLYFHIFKGSTVQHMKIFFDDSFFLHLQTISVCFAWRVANTFLPAFIICIIKWFWIGKYIRSVMMYFGFFFLFIYFFSLFPLEQQFFLGNAKFGCGSLKTRWSICKSVQKKICMRWKWCDDIGWMLWMP